MNVEQRLKTQIFNDSLLAPGPVNLHPQVQQALAWPMIHHRTPQFDSILKNVLEKLKPVFATQQPVYIHSSTGSGGMESLLVNVLSPGDAVLAIVSGKFGERWAEMAQTFGAHVETLTVPWGQAVDPEQVKEMLTKKYKGTQNFRAVLCQACETSTAVKHPIEKLGSIISKFADCLFLVDGITAVGAFPVPMDAWQIDGLVAGSQKAFMLPTGLSFVSFSQKAQKQFDQARMPRYYFDIRKEKKANQNGETFFSSSVALIRALDVVLDLILQQTLPQLYEEIAARAEVTRQIGQALGLSLYSQAWSESLTALQLPASIDGQKLRTHLETKYKTTVMGGQDQAKGKILRIGHMGYVPAKDMIQLFTALDLALKDFGLDRSATDREQLYALIDKSVSEKLLKYSKYW